MKPDFKPEAIKHAKLIYPSDSSTRHIVAAADFEMGADYGYSVAMDQSREFYLLVREMLVHFNNSSLTSAMVNVNDKAVFMFADRKHEVLKHLAAFTEREQQQLPFK